MSDSHFLSQHPGTARQNANSSPDGPLAGHQSPIPEQRRSVRDAARDAIRVGAVPVRLHPRQKRPVGKEWGKQRPTPEDFDENDNIGIKVGASSGLVDVDCDWPESRFLAPSFLPPTGLIHGRTAEPCGHRWYRIAGDTRCTKLVDPTAPGKEATIVEFRGGTSESQAQTMIPPSIHPDTGEELQWERRDAPAKVTPDDLRRAVELLAAASILARHWPPARHEASLALTGALVREGWEPERAAKFMTAIAQWVNRNGAQHERDGEPEKRLKQAHDAHEKLKAGSEVTGFPKLQALGVPHDVIALVRSWLALAPIETAMAPNDNEAPGEATQKKPGINPLKIATQYATQYATRLDDGALMLRRWRGDFYRWDPTRGLYLKLTDEQVEVELYRSCKLTKRSHVGDVMHALRGVPNVVIDQEELGSWLEMNSHFDSRDLVACRNGILELSTWKLFPPTPNYFTTNALGVAYEPIVPTPRRNRPICDAGKSLSASR